MDKFFKISERGSNVRSEIVGGVTTFFAMAYIIFVNPGMLSQTGMDYSGVLLATCISAAIGCFLTALLANAPFAQAPGMGLNAFFAYTVVLGMGYTYGQALVIVFLSGIFFIIITAVGLREAIIRSIPEAVKSAITPGVGLFITIIGLKNAGLVVANSATLVSMVDFSQWRSKDADLTVIGGALTALIGLIIMGVLYAKRVKGSIFIGIIAATLIGIPLGVTHVSNFDMNIGMKFRDFAEVSFLKMDFAGLFAGGKFVESLFTVTMLVISFSLVNMFDSIGTLLGAAKQSGMIDENGEVIRMKQALMSDAVSTAAGAMVGTSTVTTVVESSSGIAEGGRTGLTSMVTALLFLGAILFAPIVNVVPSASTAPALIFV